VRNGSSPSLYASHSLSPLVLELVHTYHGTTRTRAVYMHLNLLHFQTYHCTDCALLPVFLAVTGLIIGTHTLHHLLLYVVFCCCVTFVSSQGLL
jgi:hypothetical protein